MSDQVDRYDDLPEAPNWVNPYEGRNVHEVQSEARLRYPQGSTLTFTDVEIVNPDVSEMVMVTGGVNGDPICTPDKGIYIPVFVFEPGKIAKTVYVAEPNIVHVALPHRADQQPFEA